MQIKYVTGCAGGNKTGAMLDAIKRGVSLGERYVISMKSIQLIESTIKRTSSLKDFPKYKVIHSRDDDGNSVASTFRSEALLKETPILFVTHHAILNNTNMQGKNDWNLIVDEIPPVDTSGRINLGKTWDQWAGLFEQIDVPDCDGLVRVIPRPQEVVQSKIDFLIGKAEDDTTRPIEAFLELLQNPHYETYVQRSLLQSAEQGDKAQLQYHAWMQPTIFLRWKEVTIMGANFENSTLHMVWSQQDVEFEQSKTIIPSQLKHSTETGKRLKVVYFTEHNWSKSLRNRAGGIERITSKIADRFSDNHIYIVNHDVDKKTQYLIPNGTDIPIMAQGLNEYIKYHNVVYLAALNDMGSHFKVTEQKLGITGEELRKAKSHENAYQAILRCSLRVPGATDNVTVIVPDRSTAEFLRDMFPGSKQEFWDLGIDALGQSGRANAIKKVVQSSAERMKKNRELKKLRKERLQTLKEAVRADTEGQIVITFQNTIYERVPTPMMFSSWDEVKEILDQAYQHVPKDKMDNQLFSGTMYDPEKEIDTNKGIGNILYSQVIQLDFDESDLNPKLVHKAFSDFRNIIYNSFNNGKNDKFRYRVFIPLLSPVEDEDYRLITDLLVQRVRDLGYFVGQKANKPRRELDSGLDFSKRKANDFFYLPCQAMRNGMSFYHENWNQEILDPIKFVERINEVDVEYETIAPVDNRSDRLKALYMEMLKGDEEKASKMTSDQLELERQRKINKARDDWASSSAGEGNDNFFKYGVRLKNIGLDLLEVKLQLEMDYALSSSDAKARKAQIPTIISSLKRKSK